MPELPDITVYIDALRTRLEGRALNGSRILSPFLLRTAEPTLESLHGARVTELRRLGKRIAIGFQTDVWLVFHLMIAGRFAWSDTSAAKPTRQTAAVFEFDSGALSLSEAGSKKRASLHIVAGTAALREHDRGGIDVLNADTPVFDNAMRHENHTLKRALTDPRILSGIGNAYSDEILHRAKLSPIALTQKLSHEQMQRLHAACQEILLAWTAKLQQETATAFPVKVTAFRDGMAVHGRFGKPCPECGTEVQRIRYASTETNYCPRCQTDGRLLADRSLSRLLKRDWPRSVDELERRRRGS